MELRIVDGGRVIKVKEKCGNFKIKGLLVAYIAGDKIVFNIDNYEMSKRIGRW